MHKLLKTLGIKINHKLKTMKKPYLIFILALVLVTNACNTGTQKINDSDFPPLENRYLGQKPPGLTPELFAPGIVSTEESLETEVLFLPDMTELSYNRSSGINGEPETLVVMEYNGQSWIKKPIAQSDADKYRKRFSPNLKEINSLEPFKDIPIWGGTLSAKGTYYFYVLDPDGSGYMGCSRLINGKYETPQKMSSAINRGKYIAHPFIAPNESYLMWDAEKLDENRPDVYISFRKEDGSWGTAINMGDQINTPVYEQRPKVTPDGKYFTFWRGYFKTKEDGSKVLEGNPYWMDAKIIETLRPKE